VFCAKTKVLKNTIHTTSNFAVSRILFKFSAISGGSEVKNTFGLLDTCFNVPKQQTQTGDSGKISNNEKCISIVKPTRCTI
jgi:hypothetical protein